MENGTLEEQKDRSNLQSFPKRRELYGQGLNDAEIAEEVGVTKGTIRDWRIKRSLPANCPRDLPPEEDARRRELHRKDLTDEEIAKEVGVSKAAICSWRERRGLSANRRRLSKEEESKRRELYEKGLSDKEIAEKVGITESGIRNWRNQRGLPPNTRGGLTKEEEDKRLELYEKGLNDREIAKERKLTRDAISKWRNNRDLAPNEGGSLSDEEEDRRMNLYEKGLNDQEIATKVGLSKSTISEWRNRRDLQPNQGGPLSEEEVAKRMELYEEGLKDREIAEKMETNRSAIFKWRKRRSLPPNSRPYLSEKENARRKEFYKIGLSDREIAEKEGKTRGTITQWRKRRNLDPNRPGLNRVCIESPFIKEFLEDCKEKKKNDETVRGKKQMLACYEDFLQKPIEEANEKNINGFLDELGKRKLASSTISHYFSALKGLYEYIDRAYPEFNVPDLRKINANKYRPQPWEDIERKPLTRQETRELIHAPDTLRDSLLISLIYYCLLRSGDAANLRMEQVNTDKRKLENLVRKGNKVDSVPYHPKLDRSISLWMDTVRKTYVNSERSPYFFISKHGKKLHVNGIRRIVRSAAEKAGIQDVVFEKPSYLFKTGKGGTSEDLNMKRIPKELEDSFREEGCPLSGNLSISVEEKGEKWRISTDGDNYLIEKKNSDLYIFKSEKIWKVFTHILRITGATHAIEDGVSLVHLQKIMSHEDLKTTLHYAKPAEDKIFDSFRKNFSGV